MAHLTVVGGVSTSRIETVVRRAGDELLRQAPAVRRGEDIAEISSSAREAARADSTPVRAELVRRIKGQIEAGTYLTDEKLEAAADRIVRDLDATA